MFCAAQFGLTAAALFVALAPVEGAIISGQLSGFGTAGVVIGQGSTDFQNPVGPPNGAVVVGVNPNNATGSYSGLSGLSGSILDFSASGGSIGLANFMTFLTFSFTLDSVVPGSNYGGQNVWQFTDIPGSVIATLVAHGTVTDSNNPGDTGTFQATFTTQYQGTTAAALIANLASGGSLALQSYSVSINSETPEPGSWAMMLSGLGLAGLGLRSRRKNN
jgi:hypothetical protein